jgi:hypothetical protein
MSKVRNFTTAKKEGWQAHCANWVKASEPFEVHDIEKSNLIFCHALCVTCNDKYQFRNIESVAIFSPIR